MDLKELRKYINLSKECIIEISDYVDVEGNLHNLKEYCSKIRTILKNMNSYAQIHIFDGMVDIIEKMYNNKISIS